MLLRLTVTKVFVNTAAVRRQVMYVCLCHGFTDGQVRDVVAAGCSTVSDVYRRLGDLPQCRKCVPEVCALVRQGRADCPDAVWMDAAE